MATAIFDDAIFDPAIFDTTSHVWDAGGGIVRREQAHAPIRSRIDPRYLQQLLRGLTDEDILAVAGAIGGARGAALVALAQDEGRLTLS